MSGNTIRNLDLRRRVAWTALPTLALGLRAVFPARGMDEIGVIALRDAGLSLLLVLAVVSVSYGLGRWLLTRLQSLNLTGLEFFVVATALGLGATGYLLLGLGLVGLLRPTYITAAVLIMSILMPPEAGFLGRLRVGFAADGRSIRLSPVSIAILVFGLAIGALSLIHALGPPWDYDGLMYHLLGPKLFLEAGRVFPEPDNWYINGPFTIEMIFTVGMAFGDDVFPKLVHYVFGILLVLGTYAFGRRWVGSRAAWLAVAVLLTLPTLPVWAAFAYIDLGWSLYEFLAITMALIWLQARESKHLIAAGVFLGLAMGSKYLGLHGLIVLGGFVLLAGRRAGWRQLVRAGLSLAVPALLVASPWYIKNAVWFGNPVFPFYFGGGGWDPQRLALYTAYLDTFGVGRELVDYLLLPWNMYAQHERFGTIMNRIDLPSILFPFLLAYPFIRLRERPLNWILGISGIRFLLWATGSQQIRFLLPIFPALAIVTGYLLNGTVGTGERRPAWRLFLPLLAVGLMAITLFYQVVIVLQFASYRSVLGLESRRAFLVRNVRVFPAARYSAENQETLGRTLLLGDGREYFCHPACVPDPDHFRWAAEIVRLSSPASFRERFDRAGVRSVLLSIEDLDFMLQHDPGGVMRQAVDKLLAWREQGCLEEMYRDDWAIIYRVGCEAP